MLCVLTFKEGHVSHTEKDYAPQAVIWSVISLGPLLIFFGVAKVYQVEDKAKVYHPKYQVEDIRPSFSVQTSFW